jgi:ssDNA-binding Zn-finger/Zn-ribbon topoisomerase 1
LIFSRQLSSTEEQKVEGYLAHKWGVASTLDSNHTYRDVPPIFDNKPLIGNMSTATITTGQNVSIQIPATRNPTSWSATGLATGLSINNSGVISGSTSYIGDFNATGNCKQCRWERYQADFIHRNQRTTHHRLGSEFHQYHLWGCSYNPECYRNRNG